MKTQRARAAAAGIQKVASNIDSGDLYFAFGLLFLGAGAWWIYPPGALVILGLIFLGMAIRRMVWA